MPNQDPSLQHPTQGGSYQRDPATGALTLQQRTAPPQPVLQADPAADPDANAATNPAAADTPPQGEPA